MAAFDYSGYEYFTFASSIKNADQYFVDPLHTLISRSAPIIFHIFASVYDIPFYHLLFGALTKLALVGTFLLLTWTMTRSVLTCFVALIALFGLSRFGFVNLNLPLGHMSHELHAPLYFSFRQIAVVFGLIATVFFIKKRYLLSSVLLALGFYVHPLNTMPFFVTFNLALMISLLIKHQRRELVSAILWLSIPYLLLVSPYLVANTTMFAEVDAISSPSFWSFILKNEPDDVSIIFGIGQGFGWAKDLVVALVAILLYVVLKSKKPVTVQNLQMFIRSTDDLILPVLVAPWIIVGFATTWESAVILHAPDFLNDIFIPLQFRRYQTVAALVGVVIFAVFISKLVIALLEVAYAQILGRRTAFSEDAIFSWKMEGQSYVDSSLGVGFAFLMLVVALVTYPKLGSFRKYWNFQHQSFEYYLVANAPVYGLEDDSPNAKVIPLSAFVDVCRFIRHNTPITAAFFNPTYIKEFETYCERQGFISEKLHGNMAFTNRRFATLYLTRFSDIHKGLTYDDLPGIVFEGGEPYAIMRQRYLSLNDSDIAELKIRYSGYDFFLTEVGHVLPYSVKYSNDDFVLYDLQRKEPAT